MKRKIVLFQKSSRSIALCLLLLSFLTSTAWGMGSSGWYYISGKAFSSQKVILRNTTFTVKCRDVVKTVSTDAEGNYEIEIFWTSACRSNRTPWQHYFDNKRFNPKYIFLSYGDSEIKIKNKWEKYAVAIPGSKELITWKRDLTFPT